MSETGFTSLILAAAGGHVEVVKTLVEKVIYANELLCVVCDEKSELFHDQLKEVHFLGLRRDSG